MRLFRILAQQSLTLVLVSVLLGVISGATFAGLIALLNEGLRRDRDSLGNLGLQFAIVAAVALGTRIASQVLLGRLRQKAVHDLRRTLVLRILSAQLRTLEKNGSHLLLGALMEGVLTISQSLIILPYVFTNVIVILASLAYLAWLSLGALGMMLVTILLGLVTYWIPTFMAMKKLEQARDLQDNLFGHFQSLVNGIKELKLHRARRKAFFDEQFLPTTQKIRRLGAASQTLLSFSSAWGLMLFFVFLGFLVFVYQSRVAIDTATLTGYAMATLYIQQPFQVIMDSVPALGQGELAIQKIEQLGLSLSTEPHQEAAALLPKNTRAFQVLELSKIKHAYHRENEDGGFTLGPIDFTLRRGELVFLVGGNGSGKTTLAKLITGLYTPEEGEIRVDGKIVSDATRDDYRQYFSAVFSDFHVFDSLLGTNGSDREARVKHYLSRLLLDRKVEVVDGVLSTTALSQGQRKRLALLAAYLEDRPIYLFDEWAADQDPQFKEIFYRELLPELRNIGKTVLAITHDDRYFHLADRVLKLDEGQLVDLVRE